MNGLSSVTIIDDKNLRGILAPAKVLSHELLEDIIDFIELSSPDMIKETKSRLCEADRKKSWKSLEKIRNSAVKTK